MIYFDTSYLARLYYRDAGWQAVQKLAATDHVACALHGQAEMLAAFHRKFREGAIRPAHYAALLGQFAADDRASAFQWLPLARETLDLIGGVYGGLSAGVFLRAADALHLAAAKQHGFKVVHSHDTHLLAAAPHFGLEGRNVIVAA